MMDRPKCGTCPYWEQNIEENNDGSESPRPAGWCHRFPPTIAAHRALDPWYFEGPIIMADHSAIRADDWCGEHPDFPAYLAARKQAGG